MKYRNLKVYSSQLVNSESFSVASLYTKEFVFVYLPFRTAQCLVYVL